MRLPCLGVGEQSADLLGEVSACDIGERCVLKNATQARPYGDPDFLKMGGCAHVEGRLRPVAADLGKRPVDRPDDVQRDVGGRTGG